MPAPAPSDLAAIQRFVATVERSQTGRDADAFLALFRPDAVWVTPVGRRLTGLEEIAAFTRRALTPALGDTFATYELEHVVPFGADAVAAVVRSRAVRGDGSRIEGEADGSKLYVLTREDGEWRFAASHNTIIHEDAIATQARDLGEEP